MGMTSLFKTLKEKYTPEQYSIIKKWIIKKYFICMAWFWGTLFIPMFIGIFIMSDILKNFNISEFDASVILLLIIGMIGTTIMTYTNTNILKNQIKWIVVKMNPSAKSLCKSLGVKKL